MLLVNHYKKKPKKGWCKFIIYIVSNIKVIFATTFFLQKFIVYFSFFLATANL